MICDHCGRPRLLDTYGCEGAAGKGYMRAGFCVDAVDIDPKRRRYYPHDCPRQTYTIGDAIEAIRKWGHLYAAHHSSPPCQHYSITKHSHSNEHPDLLAPTRDALEETGLPYIIENVPGAPMLNPVTLCGAAFDLTTTDTDGVRLVLKRHRLFESNTFLAPVECMCGVFKRRGYRVGGAYGGGSSDREHAQYVRRGGYTPAKHIRAALLGIDWPMTLHGLSQSIPPVYTEYLGSQLLTHVTAAA